jgi:hypothetical protein
MRHHLQHQEVELNLFAGIGKNPHIGSGAFAPCAPDIESELIVIDGLGDGNELGVAA